jgi:taurine dioxygenase
MATKLETRLDLRPLTPVIGAEVRGVDLSRPLDAATQAALLDAWHAHIVLLFRDQAIETEDQLRFASYFGPVGERTRDAAKRPERKSDAYNAKIVMIGNIRNEKGEVIGTLPDGEMWFHYDGGYVPVPNKATLLYAMKVPSRGGNTMVANMCAAYDRVPQRLKDRLAGRNALNVYDYEPRGRDQHRLDLDKVKHCWHPVFTTHPATGRKVLYVSRLMTAKIDGLPDDENEAVLQELFAIAEDPSIRYEHAWRPRDLLIWDNRCSAHARTDFPPEETRQLRRCAVLGEPPLA